MFPFEFIIEGSPVSVQTRNRAALAQWKAKVRDAAAREWLAEESSVERLLRFKITYYFQDAAPDVDNIIKPIQDALRGLVYQDDDQISDTRCKKRNLNGAFKIRGLSPILAKGFTGGKEFIHVKIESDTNQEELD